MSLELPYVYHGVGRSNNFLESFNVAYSTFTDSQQVKVFTPIIPNSQLIITANSRDSKNWDLELFISPMSYLVLVVLAAVSVLLISGVVIIILHWQEKKEDKKSRLQIEF